MKCLAIILFFAIVGLRRAQVKLPDYIEPCRSKDTVCIINLLKNLQPHLKQGIPEFKLPSIDPLKLPNYNQSNPFIPNFMYFTTISDFQYAGLSNFNISKFEIDLDNLRLILKIDFPHVVLTASEVVFVDGLGIKVDGNGRIKSILYNLTISFSLFGTEIVRKEKRHLNWREDVIMISIDQAMYEVDPLFKGGQNFQRLLDKGKKEYSGIFNPEVQRFFKHTIAEFILANLNYVHQTYPIDVLYLPERHI